uniref:Eclosion hormone-like protein 2 n=1 Tax=Ampulex compressa TaxID=860918 RepID=A0A1W6EWD8_AMPCP|nr:eclosion hormone-like protein 2 [Ampulex compressa]
MNSCLWSNTQTRYNYSDDKMIVNGEFKVLLKVLFNCAAPADIYTAKEDVCIVNCIQCKDMYPNVFAVGKCSEYCLSNVHNLVMPDCTVASTIVDFIYINNAADIRDNPSDC